MNSTTLSATLHLYLSRKQRIRDDIAKIRFECQCSVRKRRRYSNLRNKLLVLLVLLLERSLGSACRIAWSLKKNQQWWLQIVPSMADREFKENFRLERSTYLALLHHIGPHLEKEETNYRRSVPVEKRLCCALYSLGSSSELRTIGNLFGIGKTTAGEILHQFCRTLIDLFLHRIIRFPITPAEIEDTINGFDDKCNYPMCVGSLDGTHIQIKAPMGFETDYFNYKKFSSVVMLATVDANLKFTYINVGAPGRSNDSSVFARSSLSEVIQSPVFAKRFLTVNNVRIQSHLIADSAFALGRTLMKPFPIRPDMPKDYATFNYRLSRARCTVERAFGLFKNRFRLLHRKLEFDLENTKAIIKAAAILHNLCILSGDDCEVEWDSPGILYKKPSCNVTTSDGVDLRQALVQYFVQNPL